MNKSTEDTRPIRNWGEYNQSLCNRGSLTLWIDEEVLTIWYNEHLTGKPGASKTYNDLAIVCMLSLKAIYRLSLRGVTGFATSIFDLMGVNLASPNYTTLCRGQRHLDINLDVSSLSGGAHIVLDSSGLKLYGEGEWSVRQHGASKPRQWRKIHIGVDVESRQIVAVVLTQNDVADCAVASELLDQVEGEIAQVSADGAYDTWDVYEAIGGRGATGVIPPRRGSCIKQHGNSHAPPLDRDEHLRQIRKRGRKKWKQSRGYHQRSLVETTIGRYKKRFGGRLQARCWENQVSEVWLNSAILNRMTQVGLPLYDSR
jgi:hypothetical protein